MGTKRVALFLSERDPVRQRIRTTQLHLGDSGVRLHPVNHRYAWPTELDLMARPAGLELQHRWGWWDKTPFMATSTTHVSVYG